MKREWKRRLLASVIASFLAVNCVMGTTVSMAQEEKSNSGPTLASEFSTVPKEAKSRIRYWVPQAAMDDEDLRKDIENIAKMGYGSVEIVGMSIVDMSTATDIVGEENMWGTDNWNAKMKVILEAAKENGISVDFTNGPAWPIAMPTIKDADDPATLYEMTYGLAEISGGSVYEGVVPTRTTIRSEGTTKLTALLAYQKTAEKTVDFSTMIDLTDSVVLNEQNQAESTVTFKAPDSGDWVLFSFWEQPATQKTQGNYVIDHIGMAGAQAAIDYWENVLFPDIQDYLPQCESIFCDSLEYRVAMDWTRGFEDIFYQQKGYNIIPYLPVLGQTGLYPSVAISGFSFSDSDLTQTVRNDYLEVLTFCYNEYHLKPMQALAEKYGLNLRYQVAYNKAFEVETSALSVGIPEGESLGRKSIDNLRTMAGAVHMGDKPQYSFEGAAELGNQYGQTWEDLMWWMKRSWAAGVNMQTVHGTSYTGGYTGKGNENGALPGATWPGYSAFGGAWSYSNEWGRSTSPEQAEKYVDYMGRHNYILQKTAKVDVAVYRNQYLNNGAGGDGSYVYPDDGILNSYGYSYEFVSPTMLELDNAIVTNNRLDETGPAYKALILHNQERISTETAQNLLSLAEAGLKLVVVGDAPNKTTSYSDTLSGCDDEQVQETIEKLLKSQNTVHVDTYDRVPDALKQLGVTADADFQNSTDVLTMHTTDQFGDYYYLYNYNKIPADRITSQRPTPDAYPDIEKDRCFQDKTVSVSLAGEGRPYYLNAWTGEITPIPEYTSANGRVDLTFDLKGDEAVLVALLTDEEAMANGLDVPETQAVQSNTAGGELGYYNGSLILKATEPGVYEAVLSDHSKVTGSLESVPEAFEIDRWELQVSSVGAPENGSTSFYDSNWKLSRVFSLETLKPWNEIDSEISTSSGIGTYTATFSLEKGWEQGCGAYINLGDVEDSFTVLVNGIEIPFPDQLDTTLDIGPYVQAGENRVTVRVATTLYNEIHQSGTKDYGLLGDETGTVSVIPYTCVSLEPTHTDKTILDKVISYAEAQKSNAYFDQVIEVVQTSFNQALGQAKAVSENAVATEDEVYAAWTQLLTEIHKLGFVKGDKTVLSELIDTAKVFCEQINRFTPITAGPFISALDTAKEVLKDNNAMQEDVSNAESSLLESMLGLRYKADKSVLETILSDAAEINTSSYSAESIAVFYGAYDQAIVVNENENATQQEVNDAIDNLSSAIKGLVSAKASPDHMLAEGDSDLKSGSRNIKTGEAAPLAFATSLLILAGAGFILSKKKG